MIVNLIKKQQIFSSKLPVKVNGQYWIRDIDENEKQREFIRIEAIEGVWVVRSNAYVSIIGEHNEILESVVLKENSFLNLRMKENDERAILVTHPVEDNRQIFEKYLVKDGAVLEIGRSTSNQIVHTNKYISSHHARIQFSNGICELEDLDSTNGTYVNGTRFQQGKLVAGDIIYIMGLQIIIGKQFIAMNNPDGELQINTQNIVPFRNQSIEEKNGGGLVKEFFYRSPRFRREIDPLVVSIDAPPQPEKLETVPLALMMGPAITMGMASMGTGALSVVNGLNNNGTILTVLPTVIMSVSMLLGSIMWPIITKKHEKKNKLAAEEARQEKYYQYLNQIKDKIKRASVEQKEILEENIVSPANCIQRIENKDRTLWERMPAHEDFMNLRVGKGNLNLKADIKCPERKFTMQDDSLQDAMFMLGTEEKILENVPVAVSLIADPKLGIVGDRDSVNGLARSLILQTIALHSYDEVKIVLVINESEYETWKPLYAVPHIWNGDKTVRYLATNQDDMKALSVQLEKELLDRTEDDKFDYKEDGPYYLILVADKILADKSEPLQKLISYAGNAGYSVMMLYDEIRQLPKETSSVVDVSDTEGKIYDKDDITGKALKFIPEMVTCEELERATEVIADIELDLAEGNYILPNVVTFLEMYQVGKIPHLNPLQRWKENNPAITLQTPVGVDTNGELFYLDLHEKYHGPHGLVAGMTGSGKSEFIITYILSMAVNYHPDEVSFILIDYKGGGLAGAFLDEERGIKLPHLAGTITNLDGAAVKRSLISIQSELRRRQAIFNEARKVANEGTMDIYKYQTLYRNKVVTEPVPHLFIISDEFAELKTQQPEFMEQLISAARIGRSLGVHLILATQKPAGVVDDQIWSNSKFRACLKVQDRADSMDMIKRPDAAELSQTGRFYLQVGFNEYFALGQSAWCGANYIPSDTVEKKQDNSVKIIDNLGRVLREEKVKKAEVKGGEKIKQIVGIVKYLSDLSDEEHITVRPLWLPPIPAQIYVDDLYEKYNVEAKQGWIAPVVGEYDDPFNQKQGMLTVDFSEKGNCLVYGAAGNGKATFLTSMIYSMIKSQSAEYLNLYILDFGSETLKVFEKAPQVGGVALSYEEERIRNLVKMLGDEIENRKKLFSDYGGDIQAYYANAHQAVPNIVVVINNYTGFQEQYEELEDQLVMISRDGAKYGIYFCLTANMANGVRYRMAQNFAQVYTMQLNDPTDYAVVVGNTEGIIPTKYKGRGLVRFDKVYEFQTAYSFATDIQENIKNFCKELSTKATIVARPIPILPKVVDAEVLKPYAKGIDNIPVGINKVRMNPVTVPLQSEYIYLVSSESKTAAFETAYEIGKVSGCLDDVYTEIWDIEKMVTSVEDMHATLVRDDFEEKIIETFNKIVERNNVYKDSNMDASALDRYQRIVIVIAGFSRLRELLSLDAKDKLNVFLERGTSQYKVHFIIADEYKVLYSCRADAWFTQNVNSANGIWIGDGFGNQYLFKPSKFSSEYNEEIGDKFGYVVKRGKTILTKLATSAKEDDENE